MKVAVIGTGAMGSVYAALIADAGHEVWAIDVWQDHIDAINQTGLRVEGASGDRTVTSIRAARDVSAAGACDLYIIATKASGVAEAAQSIAPLMGSEARVLTIQNGLGAGERIAQHLPAENILLGVAEGFGASMKGPGHAHHNAMKRIRVGEMRGGMSDRVQEIAALWQASSFNVQAYEDIDQLIWEKFVCNVTFSAPCTAFEGTIGEVMANSESWAVALACAREAYAEGQALKINFSYQDVDAYVTAFGESMPEARPSMYLDHLAGRRSEIDAINGMVPVLASRRGATAPYNQTLTALLRTREARFD